MITVVSVELYRMLVSTLLILFVPKNCYEHLCSIDENLIWQYPLYDIGLTFNFITLFAFIILYGIEIIRENRMISYLEVNTENPLDNKSLLPIFEKLPKTYQEKIYSIDYIYKKTSYICIFIFIINTILSGIIVYNYNYENQTTTTFITNVLFMTNKIYYRYYIANTDKSIFYSAYLQDSVQYNDIDPKIKVDIEKGGINSHRELTTPQHYFEVWKNELRMGFILPELDITNNLEENIALPPLSGETSGIFPKEDNSSKYYKLREPIEPLICEIDEQNEQNENPNTEEINIQESEKEKMEKEDTYFYLGMPVELPIQDNEVEICVSNIIIDLPNKMGQEDYVLSDIDENIKL